MVQIINGSCALIIHTIFSIKKILILLHCQEMDESSGTKILKGEPMPVMHGKTKEKKS